MEIIMIILLILILILGLANFFKKTGQQGTTNQLNHLSQNLSELRQDMNQQLGQNRQEMSGNLRSVSNDVNQNLSVLTENINGKFDHQFKDLQESNEKKLSQISSGLTETTEKLTENLSLLTESITSKFDHKFKDLQESNDKKLTQIQETVDEKLQETLNKRISQSFEQVTLHLKNVEEGLGEMRNLASDVDSLQKVMTGVKTRGIVGEIQLGRILEQIFTASQYREQVNIQGNNAVDYAVVMPGKIEGGEVLLPIDSKFPMEDYQRLQTALEGNDSKEIESSRKALFSAVKSQAKSISEKYIAPPKTTDFAVMFLPTEGLFMEVVNNPDLYEQISRDYKVNVTGPTTMTAVLNSLQMGFKTLQIEQKSSEVYELLGAVKTEFAKFEKSLKKVHERLQQSEKEINTLITTRTNVMSRQLRNIDSIDDQASQSLLGFYEEDEND
ncbi:MULTISPECIES: DNA recombination protein RmuC [unclassified Lactococcus]|uniref:DNA recombination protein RmuC n=1 Tax=unclassified Lactococcus TaxID=2643510 RepID=UPI0011C76569|nr:MULTISPECIES: DNA recombination protein RmuC [unclassified Lactococcus]MQW23473.1 DNA recombination protein RmuC [Lactococcus sp. dk101]TXK37808.1 DNA recombination protein RmuC [Lactococcus sp. dk310]TXK49335.1 DNA recombination protein RmuC [Lactococcus sp. dk322]